MENLFRTVDITKFDNDSEKILFALNQLSQTLQVYKTGTVKEKIKTGRILTGNNYEYKEVNSAVITELYTNNARHIIQLIEALELPDGVRLELIDSGETKVLNCHIIIQAKNIKYRFELQRLPHIINSLKKLK
jgi:hypothetical protein